MLCNAPDDNPFMAGAFHGVSEADCIINVESVAQVLLKMLLINATEKILVSYVKLLKNCI